jgi:hypothetical protein
LATNARHLRGGRRPCPCGCVTSVDHLNAAETMFVEGSTHSLLAFIEIARCPLNYHNTGVLSSVRCPASQYSKQRNTYDKRLRREPGEQTSCRPFLPDAPSRALHSRAREAEVRSRQEEMKLSSQAASSARIEVGEQGPICDSRHPYLDSIDHSLCNLMMMSARTAKDPFAP